MPREGHDSSGHLVLFTRFISIHVPREGHDRLYLVGLLDALPISIHVPREGHDETMSYTARYTLKFQSTCPARGTTHTG